MTDFHAAPLALPHERVGWFRARRVRLGRALVVEGTPGVLEARHRGLDLGDHLVALIGVRHEAGVEVDGPDAPAPLADRLADPLRAGDPVVPPDGPGEVDLDAGIVHRQVPGRDSRPLDVAGLARDHPEGHGIEERRRGGDHPEAARRRVRLVPPQRVVVADAVPEAPDVVQVGLPRGALGERLPDGLAVLGFELVDGRDECAVPHGLLPSGARPRQSINSASRPRRPFRCDCDA